jgi:hypothetical protein
MVSAAAAPLPSPCATRGLYARLVGGVLLGVLVVAASGCDDDFVHGGDPGEFDATIAVTNDVGVLGSISFELRYVGVSGEFVEEDDGVRCDIVAPGAFAVVTPRSAERVSIGLSSFTGIVSPGSLVRCRVRCATPLDASDFAIALTEALDGAGSPTPETPALEVTDIAEVGASTTTSIDGRASTTTLIIP